MEAFTNTLFFGSVNAFILAFFIGAALAAFAAFYQKVIIGRLVRYLLACGADSPDSAKSLRDAGLNSPFLRFALRPKSTLFRVLCVAEKPEKRKKISVSDLPLYIPPEKTSRARQMYNANGSGIFITLLSVVIFMVLAWLCLNFIPKLIEFVISAVSSGSN